MTTKRLTPRIIVGVPPELLAAARESFGAPIETSALVREALARMAGLQAPRVRRGRPMPPRAGQIEGAQ